jgi:cytochrome d ubiquinol oxidase subunit II
MTTSISAFVWLLVMAFALGTYIVLDGSDLGIGMLLMTERDQHRRRAMMEIVASALDGNEIWLVMVGTGVFAAFPTVYSTLLSALYLPLILMLFALGFRGVAIEMQGKYDSYQPLWGRVFFVGSWLTAICQGLIVGMLLTGVPLNAHGTAASQLSFLNGYTILFAVFYVAATCLMGASWLNGRGEGQIEKHATKIGQVLAPIVVVLFLAVTIGALIASPVLGLHNETFKIAGVTGMIVLGVAAVVSLFFLLRFRSDIMPFFFSAAPVVFALLSIAFINYPYLLPPSITIAQAQAPQSTFQFLLIAEGVFIPITIAYQFFAQWLFRGKFILAPVKEAEQRKAA